MIGFIESVTVTKNCCSSAIRISLLLIYLHKRARLPHGIVASIRHPWSLGSSCTSCSRTRSIFATFCQLRITASKTSHMDTNASKAGSTYFVTVTPGVGFSSDVHV